jgi:hypothetical protein
MGWLIGWDSRAELVAHLRADAGETKILAERSTSYGRRLWWACETKTGERFIMLMLISGSRAPQSWGYKDIDESMGPVEVDCPLDLLDLTGEPKGDHQGAQWARDWRKRVRAYHARRGQTFATGERVIVGGGEYQVMERRGRHYIVVRDGQRFRTLPEQMVRT